MILRTLTPRLSKLPSTLLPSLTTTSCRTIHSHNTKRPIPPPTAFVPDVPTFLNLIGRQLSQHASKIPTWESLFTFSSEQLRDAGVEPPRARRYLLWWRERFRNGDYGIGGDMQNVVDGVAEVRIVERDGKRPIAINTPPGEETSEGEKVKGVKIIPSGIVAGSYFLPVKGSLGKVARIQIKEGMWEIKRGKKILGGERRRKYNLSVLKRKEKMAMQDGK